MDHVHGVNVITKTDAGKMIRGLELLDPNSLPDFGVTMLFCYDRVFQAHLPHVLPQN